MTCCTFASLSQRRRLDIDAVIKLKFNAIQARVDIDRDRKYGN